MKEVPFGGYRNREARQRTPFDAALTASDCVLDDDSVKGRNGYRDLTGATFGSSGDSVQGMWRYRPDRDSARTVVVAGGGVNLVTDPTSQTASDAAVSGLATPFAGTAAISGAQLGTSFYLGTDESAVAMRRVNWTSPSTYALESLEAIPKFDKPLGAVSTTLSWSLFSALTPTYTGTIVVQTSANTGFTNMDSAWRGFAATNNGADDPIQGAAATYDITTPVVATSYDWLAVTISPHDEGGSAGNRRIAVQVSSDNTTYYTVGSVWDVPPTAGAPNLLFCDLRNLLASVRASVRYIKFLVEGASGGKFIVYGYMFLPSMFLPNPPQFYVDAFNSSTGQMSPISAAAETSGLQPLTVGQANPASYPDSYVTSDYPAKTGANLDMFNATNSRVFNRAAGLAMPRIEEIGGTIVISGTTSAYTGTLTVRLWMDTANGRRLISTASKAAGTAYSFTVGYSDAFLANQLYKAGGVGPRTNALASKDQRLIGGFQNRLYISSYTPTSATSNPFPQWPDIAVEDSDGWSFDIAPAKDEQIVGLSGEGDALYILTNLACYTMSDLRPNSLPYKVFQRGCVSRRGFCYAEDRFFWAAYDGIYVSSNRTDASEMSEEVRRHYIETFAPDCHVCLGYDLATRSLIACRDTALLRYNFLTRKWTTGTLAHSVRHMAFWIDPA